MYTGALRTSRGVSFFSLAQLAIELATHFQNGITTLACEQIDHG